MRWLGDPPDGHELTQIRVTNGVTTAALVEGDAPGCPCTGCGKATPPKRLVLVRAGLRCPHCQDRLALLRHGQHVAERRLGGLCVPNLPFDACYPRAGCVRVAAECELSTTQTSGGGNSNDAGSEVRDIEPPLARPFPDVLDGDPQDRQRVPWWQGPECGSERSRAVLAESSNRAPWPNYWPILGLRLCWDELSLDLGVEVT